MREVQRALLSTQSINDVLNRVVDLAFTAVPAERAFLMLRDSADEALAARVLRHRDGTVPPNPTLSRMVVRRVMRERVAILAADATTDPGLGVTDSIMRFNIRSFMCAPLWSREEVIGVLYVDSPRSAQFGAADLDAFTALTNAAAVAIEQARLSEPAARRDAPPRAAAALSLAGRRQPDHSRRGRRVGPRGAGARRHRHVLRPRRVHDPCRAHAAARSRPRSLNAFLTRMTDVVFEHEGTLDKFLGDALLAVFGAPFDQPEHPLRAVQAAIAMRKALAEMNAHGRWPEAPDAHRHQHGRRDHRRHRVAAAP